MLTTPIFRPWRPIWDAMLSSVTVRLDELATERQKGRSAPHQIEPEILRLIGSPRVQAVLRGLRPSVRDFLQTMQEIEPLLRGCVWPRWLLLEAALEDAASAGALHLSALILRTQIEELDALRIVAAVLSNRDETSWGDTTIADAISTLNSRVLPRLQTKTAKQLVEPASDAVGAGARPADLQHAFDHLSEYIHPNYGNHILSVRPHNAATATIFIEAFIAIYEAFLSLPWAHEVDDRPPVPRPKQLEFRPAFVVLAEDTTRLLAPALPFTEIGPVLWIDAVNCFHRCAMREADQEALARALEDGDISAEGLTFEVEAIRALRERSVPPETFPEPLRTAADRLQYALLVDDERRLAENAESLLPGTHEPEDASRLSLLRSGLTLSINVIEHKLGSLARQAARMINAQNVLGATLAVRSMIEHHAVGIELGAKLQALWERAGKVAPSVEQVAEALAEAEKQIARVLAGSSISPEDSASWRALWEQTVRKPYNVLDPVRALDAKQPGFLKTYGLLSHTVHGTICTGGDLLVTRADGSKAGQSMLAQLILNLANLCDTEAMLDRQAALVRIAHQLHLIGRDSSGLALRIKEMRILQGQKLKPGRDLFGSGTESDPFRFRRGLVYHDAYYHYLVQEGINVRDRRLHTSLDGIGDRIETEDGRVIYFLSNAMPQADRH